jgi:hypothetical protein
MLGCRSLCNGIPVKRAMIGPFGQSLRSEVCFSKFMVTIDSSGALTFFLSI